MLLRVKPPDKFRRDILDFPPLHGERHAVM